MIDYESERADQSARRFTSQTKKSAWEDQQKGVREAGVAEAFSWASSGARSFCAYLYTSFLARALSFLSHRESISLNKIGSEPRAEYTEKERFHGMLGKENLSNRKRVTKDHQCEQSKSLC